MIYIVDEKEVGLLKDGTLKLSENDSVNICVKDKAKPVFTAEDVKTLMSVASEFSVDLLDIVSKEALAFVVGGLVFNYNAECTLVHMSMTIPAGYEDKIHILEEGKKAAKPRKRTRKTQPAPDSSAKVTATTPVTAASKDTASIGSVEPAAQIMNDAMNPPAASATAEDAPESGDDSTV